MVCLAHFIFSDVSDVVFEVRETKGADLTFLQLR